MNKQQHILAVHDISCFGRCSLTVALPIISATGIQTTVLPTAVLSTHTGGFHDFTFRDLTADLRKIMAHWDTERISFDAVYTGFLGSLQQVELVGELVDHYREQGASIVVDPVMADHGTLYTTFPTDFPEAMRSLCEKADLILPNITEALLLLEEGYQPPPYDRRYIEDILYRLSALGPKQVVLTGISLEQEAEQIGSACYDRIQERVGYVFAEQIPGRYHGTGDIYASTLVSSMLCGQSLADAMQIAGDFTVGSILRTKTAGTDVRFGVNFEAGLRELARCVTQNSPSKKE